MDNEIKDIGTDLIETYQEHKSTVHIALGFLAGMIFMGMLFSPVPDRAITIVAPTHVSIVEGEETIALTERQLEEVDAHDYTRIAERAMAHIELQPLIDDFLKNDGIINNFEYDLLRKAEAALVKDDLFGSK